MHSFAPFCNADSKLFVFRSATMFAFLLAKFAIFVNIMLDFGSAALICVFCATRRIRFFVSDLFQK